jgi:asparagine synthase (glutamine-hydrolysing)
MCGIAGVVHFDGRPVDEAELRGMCNALRHRGPDDEGVAIWPPPGMPVGRRATAGLGCRRLSIIDVAGGHQPITNETGDVWTVQNGEIYNFADVRARLERLGHRFTTHADTEVIVHAYEEYGDAFVDHLDGMFAIAVWDGRRERLTLARDRFGKKPLFYSVAGGGLAFASELQALPRLPGTSGDIDHDALRDYLAYMAVPAPRTIYRDVRKLPPAHIALADRHGVQVRRYWSLAYQPKQTVREGDAVERVRDLLTAAVRKRLMSDVPLGAFLSGGVDSSAVVALMAGMSSQPVKTFSIGFDDERFNELPKARVVAKAFGTDHHEFVVRPNAVEVLPRLVRHFGEPYADSSAIPTSYLAALTRPHVTVALSGDGGDEVFAGYGRHRHNRFAEMWTQASPVTRRIAKAAGKRAAAGKSAGPGRRAKVARALAAASLSRAGRYRAWAGVFSADDIAALTGEAAGTVDLVDRLFDQSADLDAVDAMLAVDTMFYLPTDLLPKMDIATMMHSVEARSPFLDRELVEFVAALPSALKVRRLTTKHVLKRAFAGVVPDQILSGAKRGFAVPIAAWFRGELRGFLRDHLSASRAAQAGLIRQPAVDAVVDAHLSGAADCAHHLWTLLMLELWYRDRAAA